MPNRSKAVHSEMRVRKAWHVTVKGFDEGDTLYASTAGKARYQMYDRLLDCWDEVEFKQISVRRLKAADVLLPNPLPVSEELSGEEISILKHMDRPSGHYATSSSDADLIRLKERGLVEGPRQFSHCDAVFYYIHWMGRKLAASLTPLYPREGNAS